MRLVLAWLVVLTRVAVAGTPATPAITAQDLIDVADGARAPDDLTAAMPLQDRVVAIHRLIRAGGSCKVSPDSCAFGGYDYEPPDPKATAKSPCFRRWELYTLLYDLPLDEMLHLNAGELRAAIKLDDKLVDFIGRDLDSHQQIELARLLQEKKREIPFPLTLDTAEALKAVKRYQLDEAVSSIDPAESDAARDALIRVVLDPRYRAATRSDAIDRLSEASESTDPFFSIITPLLADPSIEVASKVAYRTGAEMRRPATTNPTIFMRALAILIEANMGQPDYTMTYAPRGLDIVTPSGELLDHYDDGESVTTEIAGRLKTEPPLFGRDAHGNIILVGFVEAPEESAVADVCQSLKDY